MYDYKDNLTEIEYNNIAHGPTSSDIIQQHGYHESDPRGTPYFNMETFSTNNNVEKASSSSNSSNSNSNSNYYPTEHVNCVESSLEDKNELIWRNNITASKDFTKINKREPKTLCMCVN